MNIEPNNKAQANILIVLSAPKSFINDSVEPSLNNTKLGKCE